MCCKEHKQLLYENYGVVYQTLDTNSIHHDFLGTICDKFLFEASQALLLVFNMGSKQQKLNINAMKIGIAFKLFFIATVTNSSFKHSLAFSDDGKSSHHVCKITRNSCSSGFHNIPSPISGRLICSFTFGGRSLN